MLTLEISEFDVLTGVKFLLYAAKEAAPHYFVRSLRFGHVMGVMLFRLRIPLVKILSHLGLFRVAERRLMNPVFAALPFHRVTESDWSCSGGSENFAPYDLATGTVQGYQAKKNAPVKREKVDDTPMVYIIAPSIDVNRLRDVTHKVISKVKLD